MAKSKDYIVGEAGAGLVKITYTPTGMPYKVEIDDQIFQESDKELVSALFVAALTRIEEQLRERTTENMSSYKASLNDILKNIYNK